MQALIGNDSLESRLSVVIMYILWVSCYDKTQLTIFDLVGWPLFSILLHKLFHTIAHGLSSIDRVYQDSFVQGSKFLKA